MDHYLDSAEFYKKHTESISQDKNFYLEHVRGYKTLEIFSGYGRITNFLNSNGIEVFANEMNREFCDLIEIDESKKFACDFLDMSEDIKFERIVCAYNSFPLLLDDKDIRKFFDKIDRLLVSGGKAILSYSHPSNWHKAVEETISIRGQQAQYIPSYRWEGSERAVWVDTYVIGEQKTTFEYPVRVYHEEQGYVDPWLKETSLSLLEIVEDFNEKPEFLEEDGWLDFILQKQ